MMDTGYVLYEDATIVGVVTLSSANTKTGDMAQLWILRRDIDPVEAVKTGLDEAVCGACPLRGDGTGRGRSCYVNLGKAPAAVYRKYRDGGYRFLPEAEYGRVFAGRFVRLGAYGDPAFLPLHLVAAVAAASRGWTGYTHQWRTLPPQWAGLLMASADTVSDRAEARGQGWRTFLVIGKHDDAEGIECLADTRGVKCRDCRLCSGTRSGTWKGVDIYIRAHGPGAKHHPAAA